MPSKATKTKPPVSLVSLPDAEHMANILASQSTIPSMALVFHTRGGYDRALSAVTAHKIIAGPRASAAMQPGRPLSPDDEMEILHLLRPRFVATGFKVLPENLLFNSHNETMWWLPPQVHPMTLLRSGENAPITRDVMWPNLVVMATQQRLFVVAVPGTERPTEDTQCFHSPLGNIWANAEVCVGDATLPSDCSVDSLAGWNAVLRNSAFTHANHQTVIRSHGTKGNAHVDPMDYWSKPRLDLFPDSSLVPLRFALRDFIEFTAAVKRR